MHGSPGNRWGKREIDMRKERNYSIHGLLRVFSFFVFAVSILTVVLILSISSAKSKEHAAETNRMALTIILNKIDESIERTEQKLYDLTYCDELLDDLEHASSELEVYLAEKQISETLKEISEDSELVNGVWYYIPKQDKFARYTSGVLNADEGDEILRDMEGHIRTYLIGRPVESSKWVLQIREGNGYLMRLIDLGRTYCGAWIRLDGLEKTLLEGNENGLMFCSQDGKTFSGSYNFEQYSYAEEGYQVMTDEEDKSYLQVSMKSETGDYWVSYLSRENSLSSGKFDRELLWFAMIAILIVVLFLFSVSVLREIIYRPLMNLNHAMEKIKDGNMELQIKKSGLAEFELLNQTFRDMMREVKDLKIDIYEQQLAQQRIKRQYLQIQLKSHFYLNCLNIIYSLAQMKNYKLIQELTRCLGAYYRYTSDDSQELHVLERELEHVRNYMHIQEIRFPDQFTYLEEVDETLLPVKIPSLLLQTFVENALEHAIDLDKKNWIRLRITALECEGSEGMKIEVRDNGKGFEMEKLIKLNDESEQEIILEARDEIGIKNIKNRLNLIYHGKANIHFENASEGGAVVSLWIPVKRGEEDGNVSNIIGR